MALPLQTGVAAAELPVASLLARMAEEFRDLSALAESMQGLPAGLGPLDAETVMLVQSIDLLAQRLQGLATFSDVLAAAIPEGWHVDAGPAAALVTLADLQRRLLGALKEGPSPDELDDLDMF